MVGWRHLPVLAWAGGCPVGPCFRMGVNVKESMSVSSSVGVQKLEFSSEVRQHPEDLFEENGSYSGLPCVFIVWNEICERGRPFGTWFEACLLYCRACRQASAGGAW